VPRHRSPEGSGLGLARFHATGADLAVQVEVVFLVSAVGHLNGQLCADWNLDAIGLDDEELVRLAP
jgi:hypothetical protein